MPIRGQLSAPLAALLFELHLQELRLQFIRRTSDDAINLTVPFFEGYRYIFTFRESRGMLATMHAKVDGVISDRQQKAIAATYFSMINFTLALGCFQIDLHDGEMLYWVGIPLEGLSADDGKTFLRSWYMKLQGRGVSSALLSETPSTASDIL